MGVFLAGTLVSCGSNSSSAPSGSPGTKSNLAHRALVTNSISSTTFGTSVFILDASQDKFTRFTLGSSSSPQFMAVSPDKWFTLTFSGINNSIAVADNVKEAIVGVVNLSVGAATSIAIQADDKVAYAALPDAPVLNGPNGVILVMDIDLTRAKFAVVSRIPVPGVRKLEINAAGDRVLAFAATSNTVTVIDTTKVSLTSADDSAAATFVGGFDRAVDGLFSADGKTAYVFNCGAECGGAQSSVAQLDTTLYQTTATLPVDSATIGFLSGTSLYVAGSKPGTVCASGTAAAGCGQVSIVDTGSFTVKTSGILVTDGFHDHIETQSSKLFIGATHCSEVDLSASGGETRGCLSMLDTTANTVVVSPDKGGVTGIAPIGGGRTVVYVIIGNELRIYDSTKSALIDSRKQLDIIGAPVDVKYIDK